MCPCNCVFVCRCVTSINVSKPCTKLSKSLRSNVRINQTFDRHKQTDDKRTKKSHSLFLTDAWLCKKTGFINITDGNRKVTPAGERTSNRKTQTSEWTTKGCPKPYAYIAYQAVQSWYVPGPAMSSLMVSSFFQPQISTGPWSCLHCHHQTEYWNWW